MNERVRWGGAIAGVVLGATLMIARPIAALGFQAHAALGLLLGAICWWIVGVLPEYATALLMATLLIVIAGIPTEVIFGSFATPTWWLLFGAFALGFGMKKSGLMQRMALGVLRLFPRTFAAQTFALMAAGTCIGPLIPSLAAKAALFAPLSLSISDSLGFERKGREAHGLFAAMFLGMRNVAPAFVSASVVGYALLSMLPPDVQARFDMISWLLAALPWFVVTSVLTYAAIMLLYAPRKGARAGDAPQAGGARTEDMQVECTREPSATPERTPMSVSEKRMLAISLVTIALWVAQPLHGVPAHVVVFGAFAAMVIGGIFEAGDLRTGISWETLVFVGIVFGLADVFEFVGINPWIVATFGPIFELLAQNPYAFVLGVALVTTLARFVIVSELAYLGIFLAFMVPLATQLGINPWVVGFTMYVMISPWFGQYQNPYYLVAFGAVDGAMVKQAEMAKFCVVYVVICLVALTISVPYWQMLGLL